MYIQHTLISPHTPYAHNIEIENVFFCNIPDDDDGWSNKNLSILIHTHNKLININSVLQWKKKKTKSFGLA